MLKLKYLIVFLFTAVAFFTAKGQDKTSLWRGFEKVELKVAGHDAYYVKPAKPLPGNPWVWRTSFPDWHTEIDQILLAKGFYVAFINVDNQYGAPSAMNAYEAFYAELTTRYAFATKAALEAVSRGGLYAYAWAKRNPDKVTCIYAETPVCEKYSFALALSFVAA